MMGDGSTSVLVVGGGLVGLSAAVFLAHQGVSTVLAERHAGSSEHPRAIGFSPRTRELYRRVGLEEALPPAPSTPRTAPRRRRVASLAGPWFEELPWHPGGGAAPQVEDSPCGSLGIPQDRLEPLLRERAAALGADLRLGTSLETFSQDGTGAEAVLRGSDGGRYRLGAEYLVAADGHRSPLRESLGLRRDGRPRLRVSSSVLFRAPLAEYLEHGIHQFVIDRPELQGFLTTYGDGRWVLFRDGEADRSPGALREAVGLAIGRDDLDVEVLASGRWEIGAAVAQTYRAGRVLLAGDAAHVLPPNRGGYGANLGIEDAHNLAWKLAAVTAGRSAPELLDTYTAERRPVAVRCHDQLFARPDAAGLSRRLDGGDPAEVPIVDDRAMVFGQRYVSSAVLDDTAEALPGVAVPEEWAGRPGTRAPHRWVTVGDRRISTIDLFGPEWVLVAHGVAWRDAVDRAARDVGLPVNVHVLGEDLATHDPTALAEAFGLAAGGASLVRPDGFVAWRTRSAPTDPANALDGALRRVAAPTRGGSPGTTTIPT